MRALAAGAFMLSAVLGVDSVGRAESEPLPPSGWVLDSGFVLYDYLFRSPKDCERVCTPPGQCRSYSDNSMVCVYSCTADEDCPSGFQCSCLDRSKCSGYATFVRKDVLGCRSTPSRWLRAVNEAIPVTDGCVRRPAYSIIAPRLGSVTIADNDCQACEAYSVVVVLHMDGRHAVVAEMEIDQNLESSMPLAIWTSATSLSFCVPSEARVMSLPNGDVVEGVRIDFNCQSLPVDEKL